MEPQDYHNMNEQELVDYLAELSAAYTAALAEPFDPRTATNEDASRVGDIRNLGGRVGLRLQVLRRGGSNTDRTLR